MAMPKKVKAFQLFNEGIGKAGMVKNVTLPKLSRKFEEYRADIMDGPIEIDLGGEKLESSFTLEEFDEQILRQWGICNHAGVRLRLMASAESDSCGFDDLQVVMHGRWREIDQGDLEGGKSAEMKVQIAISHYEYLKNGVELVYIDRESGVERVGGTDRTAQRRKAIGLEY